MTTHQNISGPLSRNGIPARVVPGTVTISEQTVDAVVELLGICEEFLRTAGPKVLAELRTYLRGQFPPADPTWLIDVLGFNHLHLTRAKEQTR
jgi:hypothetical protein